MANGAMFGAEARRARGEPDLRLGMPPPRTACACSSQLDQL
jgi:hypothetical protein